MAGHYTACAIYTCTRRNWLMSPMMSYTNASPSTKTPVTICIHETITRTMLTISDLK